MAERDGLRRGIDVRIVEPTSDDLATNTIQVLVTGPSALIQDIVIGPSIRGVSAGRVTLDELYREIHPFSEGVFVESTVEPTKRQRIDALVTQLIELVGEAVAERSLRDAVSRENNHLRGHQGHAHGTTTERHQP